MIRRYLIFSLILLNVLLFSAPLPDEKVVYKETSGRVLTLDIFYPKEYRSKKSLPATLFFHGGGWIRGSSKQFYKICDALSQRGLICLSAAYRTKSRDGSTPAESLEDAKSAMRWVRGHSERLHIDPEKIAAGGGSAGGQLAVALATAKSFNDSHDDLAISTIPNVLILLNPVLDNGPGGYGFARVRSYWRAFSPLENINPQVPDTLILVGTRDRLVPLETVKLFQQRLKKYGKRVKVATFPGEHHGFFNKPKNFNAVMERIWSFLSQEGFVLRGEKRSGVRSESDPKVVISEESQKISPLFFGVNALYWIENDKRRDDPEFIDRLKRLKIAIMRYPGGEVADNFDWKTTRLDNPRSFPYSHGPEDAQARMSFDEFIRWKNKIGSEAILVVNLEEGFVSGDLEAAAKRAAAWVKYANLTRHYGIKYWEIGNESYHLGTRYALTSKEYAKALRLFSRRMKAVDPSIEIGAIGPWGLRSTPIMDLMTQKEREILHSFRTSKERKRFRKRFKKTFIHQKGLPSWWEMVVELAGDDFDFAVLHRYTGLRKIDNDIQKPLKCGKQIRKFRKFFNLKLHKNIPIAITEYNVARKSAKGLSPIVLSLTLGEMIGNYLESGVLISNYWPMRFKDRRAMFSLKKAQPKAPYYVFQAFSNYTYDWLLKTQSDDKMLYALSSKNGKNGAITLFLINKRANALNVQIELPGNYKPIDSLEIDREDVTLHRLKSYGEKAATSRWSIEVDPLSMTIVRFHP